MKKLLLSLFIALITTLTLSGMEPVPRCLDQKTIDQFLTDISSLMNDELIAEKWESTSDQVMMEALTNPESELLTGEDTLGGVFFLLVTTARRMKTDTAVTEAVQGYGWGPEFWDVFLAITLGMQYAQIQNAESDESESLPPVSRYIHPEDYKLVEKNFDRIMELGGDEIDSANGF